ncbi:MAG: rane protein involved in the export of O-antigen and teichoic acid [Deltaproteobacteria bacterium]|nr:rane protein involved in the export of O-antigen and teichoic acid [Deltaproteobacteria bacterium]
MRESQERRDTEVFNLTESGSPPDKRSDLTIHSFRGGILTLISQFIKFVLQIGSVVILARILTPEDYGLFAIVITIVVFVNLLKDMGLQMATIQHREITRGQVSNLFWVNTAMGAGFAALAIVAAPLVGRLYNEPRLAAMLGVLSLVYVANALTSQQQAILKRTMRFGVLALIEVVSMAVGVLVAIIAALWGAGYWSLVYMHLTLTIFSAAGIWWVSGWVPEMPNPNADVRPMLRFGWHLTGMGVLAFACRNVDTLLIGWYWGARELGFYEKAYQLLLIPLLQVEVPLSGVALSILSRVQANREEHRRQYKRIILMTAFIGMAMVAFLYVAAEKAILVILGSQWLSSVPIFRALAPAAFVDTFLLTLNWVLMSLGESAKLFRLTVAVTIVTLTGFVIGLPWGALGVAVAYSICRVGLTLPVIMYVSRHSPLRLKDVLRTLAKPAASAILAAAGLAVIAPYIVIATNRFVDLMSNGIIFVVFYVLIWLAMPGGRQSFFDLVRLFRALSEEILPSTALKGVKKGGQG